MSRDANAVDIVTTHWLLGTSYLLGGSGEFRQTYIPKFCHVVVLGPPQLRLMLSHSHIQS